MLESKCVVYYMAEKMRLPVFSIKSIDIEFINPIRYFPFK